MLVGSRELRLKSSWLVNAQTNVPPDGARRTARSRRLDGGMDVLVAHAAGKTAHEKLFAVEHRRYDCVQAPCIYANGRR